MITAADVIAKFQYALDNDWGYIWGTAGVMWTAKKQEQLEKTTDDNRANSRKYGKQWIGHMVADCSGMFVWAFKQFDLPMSHISSNIYKSYCTSSKGMLTAELKRTIPAGCAVFTGETAGKHPHVGLYVGNNTVIEAKGAKAGVVTSELTDKKWTFYGELKEVDYEGQGIGDPAYYERDTVWRPTIRKGCKGDDVTYIQTILKNLGYDLGKYGVDGDFGSATFAAVQQFQKDNRLNPDGVVGPLTYEAMEKAGQVPAASDRMYTVCIHHLDKTQADALQNNYPGATVTEE